MSKLDSINLFYARQLADVGVYDTDGSGMLSYTSGDKTFPVLLKKKRLCLPLHSLLREGDWEKRTAFNPLSEQINCGPSDVLNAFKDYIRHTVSDRASKLALLLMNLAVHSDKKKITPKSMDLITLLADADEKTFDTLANVLKEVCNKPDKRILSLILKTNSGGEYLRSCIVNYPILKGVNNPDQTVFFDVKMPRKTKDKRLIVDLLKYVLGVTEDQTEVVTGSNDRTAPFYHALSISFENMATHINKLIAQHVEDAPELEELKFGLEWAAEMKVFSAFAATNSVAAPPTQGNRGELLELVENKEVIKSVYSDETEELPKPEVRMVEEERGRDNDRDGRLAFDDYLRARGGRGRDERYDRDDRSSRRDRDDRDDRGRRDREDRDDRGSRSRDRDRDRDSRGDTVGFDSYMDRLRGGRRR